MNGERKQPRFPPAGEDHAHPLEKAALWALAAALADAEIEYEHVRALGNPKPYRELYRSGRVDEGVERYRAHLNNG